MHRLASRTLQILLRLQQDRISLVISLHEEEHLVAKEILVERLCIDSACWVDLSKHGDPGLWLERVKRTAASVILEPGVEREAVIFKSTD
jgi:hypothetical protein